MSILEGGLKEPLEEDSLHALERAATMLAKLPPSPGRDAKKAKLQKAFNAIVHTYDLPPEALAPETPLVRALEFLPMASYAPGLVRTAAGEAYLASQGKSSEGAGAFSRIKDAVVPDVPFFGEGSATRGAPSLGEYRAMARTPEQNEDPSSWDKQPLLPENDYFNPTKGGTFDTLAGALMSPELLKKGVSLTKKMPKNMEELAAQTAKEIATKKAEWHPLADPLRPSRIVGTMANPLEALGKALEDFRFRDADVAATQAGRRPISEVWRSNGKQGVTSLGIKNGMDATMNQAQEKIDNLVRDPRATARYSRDALMAPLDSPERAFRQQVVGATEPIQEAIENVKDDFRRAAGADPKLQNSWSAARAQAAEPSLKNAGNGGMILDPNPHTASADILDHADQQLSPRHLNEIAKQQQQMAQKLDDIYNKTDASTSTQSVSDRRGRPAAIREEAQLRRDIGQRARDAQHETLAASSPELGMESLRATNDMASILKGGPYIYEDLPNLTGNGAASSRFRGTALGGKGSWFGAAGDFAEAVGKTGGLGIGKVAANPWVNLVASPLARSAIAEKGGEQRMKSPWYNLYRDYMEGSGNEETKKTGSTKK